jgi:ubiquinone/menaquinone biosynthesis C-methylase UbiE
LDILTSLNENADYSPTKLQLIISAWVFSGAFQRKAKVAAADGDVDEEDYDKQSIYSLLYSIYRTMGEVKSEHGEPYEFTFNTWGYAWPQGWGTNPTTHDKDPQRFGKNAYTGLMQFDQLQEHVKAQHGKVHVVELGCGTGAGAHHICKHVLPECSYEAVDMQRAAIATANRKHVPELDGRLVATHADCTEVGIADASADVVVVCETHVTENVGKVSPEDERFLSAVHRIAKPGGFLAWGNAIPDSTWQPCFDYLESIGMKQVAAHDVTEEAIAARDQDSERVEAYVKQCLDKWVGFKIPVLGRRRRSEAEVALKNFFRHPSTYLYNTMISRRDTYRVVLFQKQ